MDLRSLLPLAPPLMRPALKALADRLDSDAAERAALERRIAALERRAVPSSNPPTPDL